jgi:peptidoglycan hydrolase CwlO-like protein
MAHSTRKLSAAQKNGEQITKNAEDLQGDLDKLNKELKTVRKQADDAQGKSRFFSWKLGSF